MTFTPMVAPLAKALGGDREAALVVMWILYHQGRNDDQPVVLTADDADEALALSRRTWFRVCKNLEERGLLRRKSARYGTELLVSVRRVSALMGWDIVPRSQPCQIATAGVPDRNGWSAKTAHLDPASAHDGYANRPPKDLEEEEDIPPTPQGAAPIGSWVELLGSVVIDADHRRILGGWLDEYSARQDDGRIKEPRRFGTSNGFFGDHGLLGVRHQLLELYDRDPVAVVASLPGFWSSWDDACKGGRRRGTKRLLAHLQAYLTNAGMSSPADQLAALMADKEL